MNARQSWAELTKFENKFELKKPDGLKKTTQRFKSIRSRASDRPRMNSENQTQLTFLSNTQQSAGQSPGGIRYLFDLPYDVRRDFCNLLDADKSWRELGD